MKHLTITFLTFISTLLFSCQSDDTSNIVPQLNRPGDKVPIPASPIPPASVVEETLDGAKRWTITFNNIDYDKHYLYQRFFSTTDGTFYNIKQVHASAEATAKADIDFLKGKVNSTQGFLLTYPEDAVKTRFKPTNLSAASLAFMANNNPGQLKNTFEDSPYAATDVQPYDYEEDKWNYLYYHMGDKFLFKTDRSPARYGYIRIIQSDPGQQSPDRVVEITVQTGSPGLTN